MWTNPRNFSIRKPRRLKESKLIVESSKGNKCMRTRLPVRTRSVTYHSLSVCVCHFHIPLNAPHLLTHSWVTYFRVLLLSSVKNLHERWAKDCSIFRELYNQMPDLELKPKINWGPLLDEKQVSYKHLPFHWSFEVGNSSNLPSLHLSHAHTTCWAGWEHAWIVSCLQREQTLYEKLSLRWQKCCASNPEKTVVVL